jgi:hypothetical protein
MIIYLNNPISKKKVQIVQPVKFNDLLLKDSKERSEEVNKIKEKEDKIESVEKFGKKEFVLLCFTEDLMFDSRNGILNILEEL